MIPARGDENVHQDGKPKQNWWRRFVNWLKHKNKDEWLEKMQEMLALVSTVIATMTFQVALNPPGGVLPASNAEEAKNCTLPDGRNASALGCAGEAVLAIRYTDDFYHFQVFNTVCFIASLSVCLLLVSGIPLHNRFQMWLLSIGMTVTLSFLALTYLYGMLLVTPSAPGPWRHSVKIVRLSIEIWTILVGLIAVFLTVRFVVWLVTKCIEKCKHRKSTATRT